VQQSLTKVDKDLVFDVIINQSVDDYDRRSFLIFYMGAGQELHWALHMFIDILFSLISIKTDLHWFIS
jgi:DNA-binding MarR family transcriptional regulator